MITLSQKQEIILRHFREDQSQRQIAKELKVSRTTVSKYIKEYEEKKKTLIDETDRSTQIELIESLVEKPKYNSKNRGKKKLTQDVINKIKFYLDENEIKKASGRSKQQKKSIDIHECLIDEGYKLSYTTVCNAVRNLKNTCKEAYIRQEYSPGDVCEFDWGEVKLEIDGTFKTIQMAVFTAAQSNYRYAILYHNQKTESFLDSHARFFEHIGGVYKTLVYDNMRVAVKKFIGITEKEPTDELLKLSMYYGFKFRFCNARSGNEKGHVEKSVEYVRRKAFAKKDSFETLKDAQLYLENIVENLNSTKVPGRDYLSVDRFTDEKEYLLPKMPKYDTATVKEFRVDKYSTVNINECRYSVPDHLVGKFILCKIYTDKIISFYEGVEIANHNRRYGLHEWSIDINHYIKTLKRKPGALANSTAIHQASPRLSKIYTNYYIGKEKDFLELLELISINGLNIVEKSITTLLKINPTDINTEKIKFICNKNDDENEYIPNKDDEIEIRSRESLNIYGKILNFNTNRGVVYEN